MRSCQVVILLREHLSILGLGISLLLMTLVLVKPGYSDMGDVADFYQGKTIKLVVGYAPGGGFDTLARLLAPRLEKVTGALVVVENRPGGGGLLALNQVYSAQPDGLTIMLVNGQAAALAQMLDLAGARFDLMNASWMGRVTADQSVVLVGNTSPFASIDDLLVAKEPVKWAGGGKADSLADVAAAFTEALGLKSRIIIGYKGSKEAALSVMRGETDAIAPSASSAVKYIRGGQLKPLVVLDRKRSPLLPEVPTIYERTALNDEQAWWVDFWSRIASIGRALMTTPGTPQDRVDYLAGVFEGILTDPEFINESKDKGRIIDYATVTELRALLDATLGGVKGEKLDHVRVVVLNKYYQ